MSRTAGWCCKSDHSILWNVRSTKLNVWRHQQQCGVLQESALLRVARLPAAAETPTFTATFSQPSSRRRRGRPPKSQTANQNAPVATAEATGIAPAPAATEAASKLKRRRGRPKAQNASQSAPTATPEATGIAPVPAAAGAASKPNGRRGRPKKSKATAAQQVTSTDAATSSNPGTAPLATAAAGKAPVGTSATSDTMDASGVPPTAAKAKGRKRRSRKPATANIVHADAPAALDAAAAQAPSAAGAAAASASAATSQARSAQADAATSMAADADAPAGSAALDPKLHALERAEASLLDVDADSSSTIAAAGGADAAPVGVAAEPLEANENAAGATHDCMHACCHVVCVI